SKEAVNKTNMIQKKYEDNANTVQYSPKLKLYADKFIDTYMNISKDSKELESREKELLKYFPSDYKKPEEKTSDTERKLNSKEFYNIKRKDKDEYETKTEEKQRKVNQNILINIPIKSENNKYVVVEYPYFTPIPDSQLNKAKMVEDNLKDNKREDNPKAKAFIEDFFNKYSSSKSDDMAYLMDNPEGLEGTREVSQIREIRLYPKGDDYVAKVEILMKDKDSPLENLEHYTLDITKKDGKYYVKNMTNSIGG
ncbi:TPA: conjugal transfer protein, partial [Staphylococcus aureus]|nr:conjugal transfer protein [Staphylococcus aureus]